MINPDDRFNLTSRRYRCSTHGDWLKLREHEGPCGCVRYWACPHEGCWHIRPCKHARGSRRARQAAKRARQAEQVLLSEVIEFGRHIRSAGSPLTRRILDIAPGLESSPASFAPAPEDSERGYPPKAPAAPVDPPGGTR